MDFEKIKSAAQEISLSETEKEAIISSCTGKRRKFSYKPVIGIAAAAAIIVVVFASPLFQMKETEANEIGNMLADTADEDYYFSYSDSVANQSASGITGDSSLFDTNGFADIYSVVPYEFSSLVNADEYAEWSARINAENGMAIVQFVEHFGIQKKDFDNANTEYEKRKSPDAKSNNYFDSDIIYSFDREIIDGFYTK